MSPQSTGDVYALELGFLADGVLRALRAITDRGATEEDREILQEGVTLLEDLAASVEGVGTRTTPTLSPDALNSFRYAAEALGTTPGITVSPGLGYQFASLAETLRCLLQAGRVEQEQVEALTDFFKRLARATFQSWSAMHPERPLGRETSTWIRSSAAS